MDKLTIKTGTRTLEVVVNPTDSVWDAFQTTVEKDAKGYDKGRGDFDIDGLRIFATDYRTAKMIAKRVAQ